MNQIIKPKKGYKLIKWYFRKEIEIPEEWDFDRLSNLYYFEKGKVPNLTSLEEKENLIPYLSTDCMDRDECVWVNKDNSVIITESDVLMIGDGTGSGRVYARKNGALSSTFLVFRNNNNKIIDKFLYYFLLVKSTLFANTAYGTSIPHVDKYVVNKTMIPIPFIEEQQKIASILSNVDASIESTGNIIEKTERLKKGLMQKLLTKGIDHTKFKKIKWLFGKEIEIPEEWVLKTVEELFKFLRTGTNSRSDLGNGNIMYIHYGDIHTKWNIILDCDSEEIPFINKIKVEKLSLLIDGDLIIADASEDHEGSGESVLLKNVKNKKIVSGLHTIALRDNKENTSLDFRAYLMSIQFVKSQIIAYVTGISVYGLSKKNLKKIKILLPPLPEQQKIASILSGVDAYIQKNQQYKEKLEILKKGLMQKLLTGKIRVKI